ncbi:hypothetical protein P7L53_16545 [Thermoleptolyngbya sichuanensis XZ-Cy5]|uniref:hypothetical protein n=1 Tax=Thermoleptolyngbya sichuanensis TaxID=2885951 RepID=UPI00240DBDD8|nr:hypothetical protein [Thermoleptolyngbya sichuanensis]MDG2617850.1 hypothetical protein [Thermoleptolyngbya sichuanensis XZ-Cy5]
MKLNSTVALTLILLTLMAVAGVASGIWGYALGREALRGVTQPDVRPTSLGSEAAGEQGSRDEIIIIPESKIIEDVKNRINNSQPARSSTEGLGRVSDAGAKEDAINPVNRARWWLG